MPPTPVLTDDDVAENWAAAVMGERNEVMRKNAAEVLKREKDRRRPVAPAR